MLNLDTHILIFALSDELTLRERRVLSAERWTISAIVLWEVAKLAQLGRITIDLDDPEVIRVLSSLHVWPLDLAVSRASTRLDFRSDPADEIIAATSVVHGLPLMTRDKRIRKSKLVRFA
ncbi:MAG: PIN domain-containing protein [Myxococcales bacterium]|nr:PIN domain-containing protein [Myxococcales bacterium]